MTVSGSSALLGFLGLVLFDAFALLGALDAFELPDAVEPFAPVLPLLALAGSLPLDSLPLDSLLATDWA